MGISESKKNSILPYAVAGVLFVVACVLQQTDDLVSDLNTSNIKIQAHFRAVDSKPSVEIKVNGGTGAGVVKKVKA